MRITNIDFVSYTNARRASTFLTIFLCVNLLVSAQKIKEVVILHTNDTHSRIEPTNKNTGNEKLADKGGFVRRATYIDAERKIYPDLLLFDCGDFSQGTPYYNLFKGEVEVKMMNAMKYDAVTIGNHEFDFGLDNLHRLFTMAEFPVVCCNYDFTGTVLEDIVKPYIILKRNGLKIGVFGVSPQLQGLVQEKNFEGVTYHEPNQIANEIAAHLKKKEKCDLVICLSHLGWKSGKKYKASDEDFIANTRNIDIVLGGHSHSLFEEVLYYKNLDGKEIPLNQVGGMGLYVGKIIIQLTKK